MKKKFSVFLKTNKYEIVTFLVDFATAFIAFKYFRNNLLIFLFAVVIFVLSFVLVIYLKTRDKDFFYLPLDSPGKEKDWVGRGVWKYVRSEECFEITNSNVGFIFPKTILWDDYSFEFDFKIVNKTCAWIVRAINLSNYIMLQADFDGINPHIRLDGNWIVKKYSDADVNLGFNEKLAPDKWYKARVICEKRSIRITINDPKRPIFDRHWKIPDGFIVSYREREDEDKVVNLYKEIDFDFGAIGFRNAGDERGFIKYVYIQRL